MNNLLKSWWKWLRYEPSDPRFNAGGVIKIAVIGGGTGLSTLLRGLKNYSNEISAIVAVTDDGTSTGILRKDYDILAPGDIRQCISALAYDEETISKLFEYRFARDKKSLEGHTLGNIWITALSKYFGSFEKAIETTSQIFRTAGKVLPATLENVALIAEFENGKKIEGESKFVKNGGKIKRVFLNKSRAKAYKKAALAVAQADLIIIGPGSLYTSVIPNLLIGGIRNAIKTNKKAVKVYIANCSTERGETQNYSVKDHLDAIFAHSFKNICDFCLVNIKVVRRSINDAKLGEVNNITEKKSTIGKVTIIRADVVSRKNPLYHDSDKLAKSIIELYNKVKKSK